MVQSLHTWLAATALAATALLLFGCGPGTPEGKLANVEPGPMPAGAGWEGQYFSPLFGTLNMKPDGNLVRGKWTRPLKDKCGRLQGNADGNLLRFDWEEDVIGLAGPNSRQSGKGYFVYARPSGTDVDDVIDGQVGRGKDEVGIEWHAIKQRNVKVDMSGSCGGGASDVGGGDWDKGNSEKGKPEPPAEPPADEAK